jgi:Uma2 family endonuclease
LAIEILSPKDRAKDVAEKIRVYLATGARAVLLVDTHAQTVTIREPNQTRLLGRDDFFEHEILPGFRMAVSMLFLPIAPK